MTDHCVDFTPRLRELMREAQVSSLGQLSQTSGVPRSQLVKIRRGELARIPLGSFIALAKVLKISPTTLLETFGAIEPNLQQKATTETQWQQSNLNILESLILQLPTAEFAAQKNPTAPAIKLLPLLKPLHRLLTHWNVEPIGQVGASIEFNPQYHQWMGNVAMPERGTPVKVRYVGYLHGDRLLYRAKVDHS